MTSHDDFDPYVFDARPGPWQRRLCAAAIVITLILFCLVAFPGCYGTAIDTRSITADEVTISQNTPWSNLTITAKGWKSDVKGQPSYAPPGPHVEASAEDRPGVGLKAPGTAGAPSSPDPHVKSELDEKKKQQGVSGLGSGEPLSKQ